MVANKPSQRNISRSLNQIQYDKTNGGLVTLAVPTVRPPRRIPFT